MRELALATLKATVLVVALLLAGCGGPSQQDVFTVVEPDSFEMDGLEWKKSEWTAQVEKKVARHFRKASDVADNPILGGTQVCYSNGTKQRLFWLDTLDGSCQWAMIEFKGTRGGNLVEGTGAPFSQLLATEP